MNEGESTETLPRGKREGWRVIGRRVINKNLSNVFLVAEVCFLILLTKILVIHLVVGALRHGELPYLIDEQLEEDSQLSNVLNDFVIQEHSIFHEKD
jgi:hypothetical protein